MLTLWLCITDGCGDGVIKPMVLESPALMLFWAAFIFIASFGMLNVIVGLFCENVLQSAAEAEKLMNFEREKARQEQIEEMKQLFLAMDRDASKTISRQEWLNAQHSPEVVAILEHLGLDDDGVGLFDTLDVDQGGLLEFAEFFEGLMLVVKGNESAKAEDMVPTFLICQYLRKKITLLEAVIGSPSGETTSDNANGNTENSLHGIVRRLDAKIDRTAASLDVKIDGLGQQMQAVQDMLRMNAKLLAGFTKQTL
eukprot:gnl/MRDRNA2_/MRDRNA2_149934_c0_seq1.p1 gnl/MRDRNA2_/MRDRNA2_149934_c0~~gnl/MRDRNA2_/MRDRNA2_149934_c0_seq1.p1  ORF type:complete len:292 (-),score=74.44 gnl/MRDRNA2_/MRDRNA2_149934_c0_seq1:359-1120(-)